MPRPFLSDTGQQLVLDLHGATIEEALRLTEKTLILGSDFGRDNVKIIHGSSTSGTFKPTIKNTLHQAIDSGRWDSFIQSTYYSMDYMLLGLLPGKALNPSRLGTLDIW